MLTQIGSLSLFPQTTVDGCSCPPLAAKPGHSISINHSKRYKLWAKAVKHSSGGVAISSVPVRVAHELLQAGNKYLDVRTCEEFSGGHPPGAINIPYLYTVGSEMAKNPNFVAQVSSHFRKHDEFVVGCQMGKRSMMAAMDLIACGFTGITDIAGGYAAWAQTGLGTEW